MMEDIKTRYLYPKKACHSD